MISVLDTQVVKEYADIMTRSLHNSFPTLNMDDLRGAVEWSINNRFYNAPASIKNNYKHKVVNGTVLDILNYIEKLQPIVTSSGVLFKKHKDSINPLTKMIMGFIKKRKAIKKEMFKYPKGSEMFERYNLLQLLEKLNANGTYGVIGAATSVFYNLYVASAVTRQGRSYISCSIMLFESLLANNVKFNNLNEIITFMDNVVNETSTRVFNDNMILDDSITQEECFFKIMNTVDMMMWVPTDSEMQLVWEYICGLDQQNLNRLYYKNNLYSFCENPYVLNLMIGMLCKLDKPFMDPNVAPKEIENDLKHFTDLIYEYVYYGHFYIDKLDRIEYMQRDIVIVSDTDSTIISYDAWYNFLLGKSYNVDMKIKREMRDMVSMINVDEFGDEDRVDMCTIVEPNLDYDFYTDEVIELDKLANIGKIIPQDSLKYSIINIMAYACSVLVKDYLERYTKYTGSYVEGVPCRMVMKNEYYFLRLLLTESRRNYASKVSIQEGNPVPESASLSISGMPINKTTLSDGIKHRLQRILYEDIMVADKIDQVAILKKLSLIERDIYQNIMDGKTDYYKPDNVAAINSYANPMSTNGILAIVVHNYLKDDDAPKINLDERNKIFKIKIDINKNNVDQIKDKFPSTYEKMIKMINDPILKGKTGTIGFLEDSKVPEWIMPFIDYKSIIINNMKNFPLESLGLTRLDNDNVTNSNIIQL